MKKEEQNTNSPVGRAMSMSGHLYMQSNELRNQVIHYRRATDGTITEAGRYMTGGAGSGAFNYRTTIYGLNVEGAAGIIITPDRRFLLAANVKDNSVSSFAIGEDGTPTLLDAKRTGNAVAGPTGTAKSMAYAASSRTLYVAHTIGPNHITLMTIDEQGMLTVRPERYNAVPQDKPRRVTTMIQLSPDERFLLVGCSVDELPALNPDGSPIIWVQRDGKPHPIAANAPDPDGLAIFPVEKSGALGAISFQDSGASSPWCPLFLNKRPDHFVIGYATADGLALATLGSDGKITVGPVSRADTTIGRPSELCWMTITPDDSLIFATMTGFSYITSWRLEGNILTVAKDPACPKVPGDGTFRGFAGIVGAGPTDMWMTSDGAYLYQMYPGASKMIGYAVQPDGSLEEVTRVAIPYNSSMHLTGF